MVLLLNAASTWAMVGLIWFVQMVHYPLFAGVGAAGYVDYQALHMRTTGWVVGPLMLMELVTSLLLVVPALRPAGVPPWLLWAGLATVAVNWLSTVTLQIPAHDVLTRGFDLAAHRRLVLTNWIRTAAWTLHGVLTVWAIHAAMRHQ